MNNGSGINNVCLIIAKNLNNGLKDYAIVRNAYFVRNYICWEFYHPGGTICQTESKEKIKILMNLHGYKIKKYNILRTTESMSSDIPYIACLIELYVNEI